MLILDKLSVTFVKQLSTFIKIMFNILDESKFSYLNRTKNLLIYIQRIYVYLYERYLK